MLQPALIFLLAAVLLVPLAKWLKLGAVLGFLAGGMLIGPSGLGLVRNTDNISHISELGVVLLLFIIGLELSPRRLWVMRRDVFGVGLLQVVVCMLAIGAIAWLGFGEAPRTAIVLGAALALSSTAMGLQILAERKQLQSPAGRLSFSILLFQDIAAIPLLAIIPLLDPNAAHASTAAVLWGFGRVLVVIALVVVGGRYLVRPLFRMVAKADTLEVSIAAAFLVVLGTGWLVQQAGISMALGAFLAGVLLADSPYRHELESHLDPFKGLLLGLFFISVGMSARLDLVLTMPLAVLGLTLLLMSVKGVLLWAIARTVGRLDGLFSFRTALVLASGGEFAFVVLSLGQKHHVLDSETSQLMVLVITLSMALTPLLVAAFAALGERRKPTDASEAAPEYDEIDADADAPRVVIAGFGRVGQIVGRILSAQGIPFVALENSYQTVETSRRLGGTSIFYGDSTRPELLRAAQADKARVLVLATGDPKANIATARMVRRMFPQLKVVARARNRRHAFRLMDMLEPDHVIRETFFSSLEMSRHVLAMLGQDETTAEGNIQRFAQHDRQLLEAQHLVYDDEAKLLQTSREALADLEELFASDPREGDAGELPEA